MSTRRILQICIVGLFVFAALFAAWGVWQLGRHRALLEDLAERGVRVSGTIVDKGRSHPSGSSSASPSFVLEVEHRYEGRSFTNPYAVSRAQYEASRPGDSLDVTLLPDEPRLAQPTAVVQGDTTHRGFIPLER